MRYFIGIDTGGTRTKAAMFDERGVQIASAALDTPLLATKDGFQERDMDELWAATLQVLRETVEQAGVPAREIAGTWGINEYISREPAKDMDTTRNSLYCIPGWYLIEESSPASSGNLEWVRNQLLSGEERSYDSINAMVESVAPEDSGVIFAPYLYGSNVAGCDCGLFFGLNNAHTKADLLRAVFEGVVYTHRIHIDRLLRERPAPAEIRLAGGAAASPIWAQMFADVLNCPVEVVPASELGALGCAMASAVAAGVYPDYGAAAAAMTQPCHRLVPDATRAAVYEKKYRRYTKLLDRVRWVLDEA